MANAGGYAGATKVVGVGVIFAYSASVNTNPRYPWSPPPKSLSTLAALTQSSALRRFSVLLVGVPWMGVGVLYLK